MRRLLSDGVAEGVFPGAQLSVVAPSTEAHQWGGLTAAPGCPGAAPVTGETRFDLASLTKVLVTSVLLMKAVELGRLSLDDPVGLHIPGLTGPGSAATVEQLATHRSGFIDHDAFYERIWEANASDGRARRLLLEELRERPLCSQPGSATLYSDPGYILLGWILEQVLGDPLDRLFRHMVAEPLGLVHTRYGPVRQPVAATERDERGELLWGTVHDENCRALGGIEGHAGLFGTAAETMAIVRHLAAVHAGGEGVVRPETVQRFWADRGTRFTLGWDTPSEPSSSGRFTTRGAAVGHLGFTGCSVWHDIARDVTVVLVSNRVHPTRENIAIRAYRPRLHDEVNRALADRSLRSRFAAGVPPG